MSRNILKKIRRWIVVASATFFVGGAYGLFAAMLARFLFKISENSAWLFVAMPVAIIVALFMHRKMAKIFGVDDM